MFVIASCLLFLLHQSSGIPQQNSSDKTYFNIALQPNEVKYVKSPNYPNVYESGSNVVWTITCPPIDNCWLNCTEFDLPETTPCGDDSVIISKIGSLADPNAKRHCGNKPFSVVSDASTLLMQLTSDYNRVTTGKFNCMATTVPR